MADGAPKLNRSCGPWRCSRQGCVDCGWWYVPRTGARLCEKHAAEALELLIDERAARKDKS